MEFHFKVVSRFMILILITAVASLGSPASAQTAQLRQAETAKSQKATPYIDGWGTTIIAELSAAPAPAHDISGIWEPVGNRGVQQLGAGAIPEDGKPEHQLPYTPAGFAKLNQT